MLDHIEPSPTGEGYIWVGQVADMPFSAVTLVVNDDFILGEVRLPGSNVSGLTTELMMRICCPNSRLI
ncbi:MAG: hypothetical protein U0401_30690 [Anaerolineae bacterium]